MRRKPGTRTLLSFEELRRSMRAYGGIRRGKDTVELSHIVGSAGKHDWFDEGFMPLCALLRERWKRIDRAFWLGHELPPVALYKLGSRYFVKDGHHHVSATRFHGAEWIDAEIKEFMSPADRTCPRASEYHKSAAMPPISYGHVNASPPLHQCLTASATADFRNELPEIRAVSYQQSAFSQNQQLTAKR